MPSQTDSLRDSDPLYFPSDSDELSIYIHVPFCDKKCPYCDFFVVRNDLSRHLRWKDAVCTEASLRLTPSLLRAPHLLRSIYFGGGTPSLVSAKHIAAVIDAICASLGLTQIPPNCEVTLEANPTDLLDPLAVSAYLQQAGVNRFSVGVQSFNDRELTGLLGRNHQASDAITALETLFACGAKNVSIDLITELPKTPDEADFTSSLNRFQETLATTTALIKQGRIHHLSLYNLLIQEGTLFAVKPPKLPPEKISMQLLNAAISQLTAANLERYEISAFAKKGYVSVHNSGYWRARRFIGLGPSAHSYTDALTRTQNISSLNRYCSALLGTPSPSKSTLPAITQMQESLPQKRRQAELLSVALRLSCGIDIAEFTKKYGPFSKELTTSVAVLKKMDLLRERIVNTHARLQLTEKGCRLYNEVGRELVILEEDS